MSSIPGVGDPAIDFTLPSTRGSVRLSELLRDGAVLLVFHPKDNTLVCTRQLCNYRDSLSTFEDLGVQVVAINDDALETHEAFARKYGFPFPLASDVGRRVCQAYGVLLDLFKLRRALVLIGEDGRIWWRHAELRVFHRSARELAEVIAELRREH
ncbi:MAG TPA: peroxiredoxin [Myxococcota bacterium]|jgi:peroxiredoxin Q/BCP|nr:peroxiredoxin [Myxococcota bacterium]